MISDDSRKMLHELLDKALDCGGSVEVENACEFSDDNGFQVAKPTGERYILVSWKEGAKDEQANNQREN